MADSINHSNRLFHGEIHTFLEACRAMIGQYRQEAHWISTKYAKIDREDALKGLEEMEGYIAQVEQCRQDYAEALRQMEGALIAKWSASEDEMLQMLGEALESGDYSRLAL